MPKLSPITLSLIAAAANAYPDGLVSEVLNPENGERLTPKVGDTLAEFIAIEIAEVTEGYTRPTDAAETAARALRRARDELDKVIDALDPVTYDEPRV